VVGVALLVLGVVVPQFRVADIPLISVLGFLVMFFGVMLAVTSIRHGAESDGKGGGAGSRGAKQWRRLKKERKKPVKIVEGSTPKYSKLQKRK